MPLIQGSTIAPTTATIVVAGGRLTANDDGTFLFDTGEGTSPDGSTPAAHASTHSPGGTDPLDDYANIADLAFGTYTLPMSSVEPGVTNSIIVALPGGTLDSIANGGANTVLRGGASGGGLTGMTFGTVTDSHFGGQLLLAHGGTGLSSYTAGDTLYYASSTALSKLAIGASGTIYTSTGSAPQWSSSLTKAQQHAQTAYLDAANVFTVSQQIAPTSGTATLSVRANSVVGGAGLNAEVSVYATPTIRSARFYASNASSAGNRFVAISVETDHDGVRIPLRFLTLDATNSAAVAIEIGMGNSAGHVAYGGSNADTATIMVVGGTMNTGTTQHGMQVTAISSSAATVAVHGTSIRGRTAAAAFTTALLTSIRAVAPVLGAGSAATVSATHYVEDGSGIGATSFSVYVTGGDSAFNGRLGINLGASIAPSAKLHVVETSSGAVPETVRLGNQSNTSGSGTEIGFHAAASGAQKYASIQAVTEAASAARGAIVLATQRTSSGDPVEAMRCDGKGNVSIGTTALATSATDGFIYIPTCAGTPTGVPTAKAGLIPHIYDSTNNKHYFYNGGWKTTTVFA